MERLAARYPLSDRRVWSDAPLGALLALRRSGPGSGMPPLAARWRLYLGGSDPTDPAASLLFGRFAGAPPVLVQAGAAEILRADAVRMVDRIRADGFTARLDLVHGVPHVFQALAGVLPEADAALDRATAFLRGKA